ncbi:MAG: hypothetical protein AAGJ93_13550 [Bacteroidota bacterium]
MNDKNKILDAYNHPIWGKYIDREEEILWEGRPQAEFTSKILTGHTYYDVVSGFTSPVIIYLTISFFIAFLVYGEGRFFDAIPLLIVLMIVPLIIEYIIGKRKLQTTYALSKTHLLFRFKKLTGTKIYAIHIDDLISVGDYGVGEDLKTVYFVPKDKVAFKTYNFETGRKRFYPTFGRVSRHEELLQLLQEKVVKNKLPPRVYTDKVMAEQHLRFAKRLIGFFLISMSVFPFSKL